MYAKRLYYDNAYTYLELPQQDASRAKHEAGVLPHPLLPSDLVADCVPQLLTALLSDSCGDTNGGQSTRLCADDAAPASARVVYDVIQNELGGREEDNSKKEGREGQGFEPAALVWSCRIRFDH